jgi:hypothetical protein
LEQKQKDKFIKLEFFTPLIKSFKKMNLVFSLYIFLFIFIE